MRDTKAMFVNRIERILLGERKTAAREKENCFVPLERIFLAWWDSNYFPPWSFSTLKICQTFEHKFMLFYDHRLNVIKTILAEYYF